MKNVNAILLMVLCCWCLQAQAQSTFSVPEKTVEAKHGRTFFQMTGVMAAGISYAKSNGQTAEEYGSYMG